MGRAHDTRRCAKRICCRSGNGGFAACSGRKSTGTFFSLHIYSSIQAFFFTFVSRPVDSTRPDQHFFLSGNGGDAFCPIIVLKNAPGTLQTPRGRYFGIILWNAPGGVYSVLLRYVHTTDTSTRPPWHVYNVCVVPSYIKSTYRTTCALIPVLLLLYKRGSGP